MRFRWLFLHSRVSSLIRCCWWNVKMTCVHATHASFKSLLENLSKLTEVFWFTWQRVLQLKSSHIYYCQYCFVMLGLVNIHWETVQRSIAHRPNSCVKGPVCLCVSAIEATFRTHQSVFDVDGMCRQLYWRSSFCFWRPLTPDDMTQYAQADVWRDGSWREQ